MPSWPRGGRSLFRKRPFQVGDESLMAILDREIEGRLAGRILRLRICARIVNRYKMTTRPFKAEKNHVDGLFYYWIDADDAETGKIIAGL
jgi:hypothetical protein